MLETKFSTDVTVLPQYEFQRSRTRYGTQGGALVSHSATVLKNLGPIPASLIYLRTSTLLENMLRLLHKYCISHILGKYFIKSTLVLPTWHHQLLTLVILFFF